MTRLNCQGFPSLQLLVAPPDLHGCPDAFVDYGPVCCMPSVVRTMLEELGNLSPQLMNFFPSTGAACFVSTSESNESQPRVVAA
eukprot:Skav234332  [mRNA]  locus=scaffold306:132721:136322:+ [translate_table: standard]